jgi:hypothetical protein
MASGDGIRHGAMRGEPLGEGRLWRSRRKAGGAAKERVGCRLKPRRDPLGDAVCATRSPLHSGLPRIATVFVRGDVVCATRSPMHSGSPRVAILIICSSESSGSLRVP